MYLLAASYLGYAGLVTYVQFGGPENPGIRFASLVSPGPAIAVSVAANSPAAVAGIREGDHLVLVDGRRIRDTLNWVYAFHYAEIGRPVRVTVQRGNTTHEFILRLGHRTSGPRGIADWVRLARAALAFSLAVFIAFSRPHDLQARVAALLLAEVGLFGLFFLNDDLPGFGLDAAKPAPTSRDDHKRAADVTGRRPTVLICRCVSAPVLSGIEGMAAGLGASNHRGRASRLLPCFRERSVRPRSWMVKGSGGALPPGGDRPFRRQLQTTHRCE